MTKWLVHHRNLPHSNLDHV